MWQLKNTKVCLPGGYCYTQTEGKAHKFESKISLESQANAVCDFRQGNKLARSKYNECVADVDYFNCQRFNFDKKFCLNTDREGVVMPYDSPAIKKPCGGCGAKLW
jgi:hypothetical protein